MFKKKNCILKVRQVSHRRNLASHRPRSSTVLVNPGVKRCAHPQPAHAVQQSFRSTLLASTKTWLNLQNKSRFQNKMSDEGKHICKCFLSVSNVRLGEKLNTNTHTHTPEKEQQSGMAAGLNSMLAFLSLLRTQHFWPMSCKKYLTRLKLLWKENKRCSSNSN